MKVTFSRNFEGGGGGDELNQNGFSILRLPYGCKSNILGTFWCVNLKLTGLVVRDVELARRKYLRPIAAASTHTTAIVTIITTSIATAATKA